MYLSVKMSIKSSSWRFKFFHLILWLIWISKLLMPGLASNGVDDMELPALGRTASLGDLYDERTDQFRSSVFKEEIPAKFIKLTDKPYTFAETAITNTIQQKFTLLKLDASIQASILSGMFSVSGSASYLNEDKTTSNEVLGSLLLKYQTAVEKLQLFFADIVQLYKTELLEHNGATHIVSSILWGANVAVSFKDSNSNKETQENVSGKLSVEFKKIQGFLDISGSAQVDLGSTGSHSISNYSVSVHGDVKLPNEIPTNYQQIKELISRIPGSISATNGGKGVPLVYTLTPLAWVKELMHIAGNSAENQFAQKLDESILTACIEIFEEMSKIQQIFNELNVELESFPACVAPITFELFKNLKRNFTISKLRFTADFKETLIKVRSGSLPSSALALLAAEVEKNFSGNYLNSKIYQLFETAREKINLCRIFAHARTNNGVRSPIEYFGSQRKLLKQRIQENTKKPVYIFFQKYEYIEMYSEEWNDNQNTLLHTLNRPYNKLFVVDCDFDYSYCKDVAKPIIRQFKKGKMLIEDVSTELKNSHYSFKVDVLKIKALGRFAEIGELYDARADTFLGPGVSLLPHNYPESLVVLTGEMDSTTPQIEDVLCNTFIEKVQALKVKSKDLQFSILAGLFSLKRTAQYFKYGTEGDGHKSIRCLVRTLFLNNDHISSLLDPKFEEVIQPNVLEHVEATHFVLKRNLGFTSVFTLEDNNKLPNNNIKDEKSQDISDIFNQMKSMIISSQPSKNQSASTYSTSQNIKGLDGNFKIKIYSDTQREDDSQSTNIGTSEELFDYLTNEFYPQQLSQNGGKGQPIHYELYPIQNLATELGILGPKILYNFLSYTSEDPVEYSHLLEQVETAKFQIQKLEEEMKRNPDCTTHRDYLNMTMIHETFQNSLGAFQSNFSNIVQKIKNGELALDSLQNFRMKYESHNYFGDGTQYKELNRLSGYMEKLNMVNRLRNSNLGITYIGRENGDVSFNMIFENRDASRTYVLFYKPEWTVGTEGDTWRRYSYFFFGGTSSSSEDTPNEDVGIQRFIVDCDFEHIYCSGLSQAAIYKNSRGVLIPYNSTKSGNQDGDDDKPIDGIFRDPATTSLNVTLQNAITKFTKEVQDLGNNYDDRLQNLKKTIQLHNDCFSSPCLNGGTCYIKDEKSICKCTPGFLGNQCEATECVHPGTCGIGSHDTSCKCRPGYVKDSHDNSKCRLESDNATLIFGCVDKRQGIKQFFLGEQTVNQIQNHTSIFYALDVMYRTNSMFWSDSKGNIYTAPIHFGATKEVVINDSGSSIWSLAVDWIYNYLYYTDYNRKEIYVVRLDGTMKKVIINTGLGCTTAIVVNPLTGWIYWVDKTNKNIERAGMDGSQRKIIANTNSKHPHGLALDITQNRLFWTINDHPASIHSMSVDGSNQKLVFQATQPAFRYSEFWSITTFGDHVYWRDYTTRAVYRTNKCGGEGATSVYSFDVTNDSYYTLQAHHFSKQPEGENLCTNRMDGQCSHLCFPTPSTGSKSVATTCACPDGLTLSSNQQTCT